MALIPITDSDPTLEAADKILAEEYNKQPQRDYLGASSLGKSCSRALWYSFRHAKKVEFKADTIKKFIDGHTGELVQAERLKKTPGITLVTEENGKQIGYSFFSNHLRANIDGRITGILQAPVVEHCWEHKQVNQAKFDKFKKLKAERGEKNALKAWDMVYYVQAMIYCFLGGFSRSYMTINTPGNRESMSCRTNADNEFAKIMLEKAERIIFTDDAPPRIGDSTYFECRWCEYSNICHQKAIPEVNCRTCLHSTAEKSGGWTCSKFGGLEIRDTNKMPCNGWEHLFLPGMLDSKIKTAETGRVEYEDGRVNYSGGKVE